MDEKFLKKVDRWFTFWDIVDAFKISLPVLIPILYIAFYLFVNR